eukprot:TRINITY_DN987_c0_g1_i1.p1 TRINITY_DN987_c0_g1~~TRINITY_DN987_c0_g1_i1.p1  ORF type:complete len:133 (-),score=25.31 TRINITY_DN987_c0_g1_i1:212-610(-)
MCIRDSINAEYGGQSLATMAFLLRAAILNVMIAMAWAEACCSTCNTYTGTCGGLHDKTNCWRNDVCMASDPSDCCSVDAGKVAAATVVPVIVLLFAVAACCFFWSACPWAQCRQRRSLQGTYASLSDIDGPA